MFHKNIERHIAYTIVSWPNPKQWVIVHTSDLMMIIRQSIYIISIITREMGKLKTHSPIYCIIDNSENMLNRTHTLNKLYLTGILKSSMSSDKVCIMSIMRWCNVQTNKYDLRAKTYPTICTHLNCTILMKTNSRFSRNVFSVSDRIWCNNHLRLTTRENMKTMGKVDTSNLMMIITCATGISFQSSILKCASWTHTTPYIVMKIKGNR